MTQAAPSNKLPLAGFLIALLGAVLFSTKAIIVKVAFARVQVDALTLLAIRMLFSLPFYAATAVFAVRSEGNVALTAKQWFTVIFLGLFGYYLSSLFDFLGLQYISAGLERLILFLYPTFAVLINTFVFKQKLYRRQLIALALTYAGIAFAFVAELRLDTSNSNFYWGSFLIFLCSITFAVYIAGSGRMIPKIGANRFTAYALLSSTAGVLTHYAVAGNPGVLQQGVELWGYGLGLAIFATVIPTFLISNAMKKIGSNNVAIISSIGPVSTIIQAYLVLGEPILAAQIVGTVLVLAGVLMLGWKKS
ncbi:MAG TPA: DMT family transporter [Chitinophagaceae bacterium]|jgi:drug/metabolite transporter (DMT)-like permease|nr:DMT family transporter [Chitinophagaceae bacterium]